MEEGSGSVAAHTVKYSIVPVHWEDVCHPGTGLGVSVPVVVMGHDVVAADCSLSVFILHVWCSE